MWHVSSRSSVATLRTAIHTVELFKLFNFCTLCSGTVNKYDDDDDDDHL